MYALQRKSDGAFMPDKPGRTGGTYVDPDNRVTHRNIPRLFSTKTAASNALRWWAQGKADHVRELPCGPDWVDDGGYSIEITPVEGRNAGDWEIVSVQLKVIP